MAPGQRVYEGLDHAHRIGWTPAVIVEPPVESTVIVQCSGEPQRRRVAVVRVHPAPVFAGLLFKPHWQGF